jgi:putative hydrolase
METATRRTDELRSDWHVHSTFSDGRSRPSENLERAMAIGLSEVCFVDHVRRYTTWVPDFVEEVEHLRASAGIALHCSVEAMILDRSGAVDLPRGVAQLDGLDLVHISADLFPMAFGPADPIEVRRAIDHGSIQPSDLIEGLVEATQCALARVPRPLLAHLFSGLQKVGLDESYVPDDALAALASAAASAGALVEVNERRRCPSVRTLSAFVDADVQIVPSTGAHESTAIGAFGGGYVARTLADLAPAPAGHEA